MKWMIAISACLAALGCKSSAPQTPTLSPAEKATADELMTEVEIGRNMTGKLLATYGVNDSRGLNEYLNLVGTYVGQSGEWTGRRFQFAVTNDTGVSAYSCPGEAPCFSREAEKRTKFREIQTNKT